MSLHLEGTVKRSPLGLGAWSLAATDGKTYEIYKKSAPDGLLTPNQQVRVSGVIRDDVMTTAMIGPVLEVQSFELIGG